MTVFKTYTHSYVEQCCTSRKLNLVSVNKIQIKFKLSLKFGFILFCFVFYLICVNLGIFVDRKWRDIFSSKMQISHNILQISVNKINEIIFIKLQEIKSIQNSINRISKKNPRLFPFICNGLPNWCSLRKHTF